MQLEWIFAFVVAFLWIVNHLLRGSEDDKRPERARPLQGEPGSPARRPRRQPSDIDRFLEEVRRRRETQDRRPAMPAPVKPATPVARPRPSQQPTIVVRPQPAEQPARLREVDRQAIADVIPVVLPAATNLRPPPAVAPGQPQLDPLQPFLDMLRKPETLWTAMMIREVFGPPACRRQGVVR